MLRNGLRSVFVAPASWKARAGAVVGGLTVLIICGTLRYFWGAATAKAEIPNSAPPAAAAITTAPYAAPRTSAERSDPLAGLFATSEPIPDTVASVNGHPITRAELATECRIHYGKDVLESMVNKFLILSECQRLGITVTRREIRDEVDQMARSFNLPVDQWLKLLQQERGIRPDQYANDVIWPSLALRKLGGERLHVSEKELTDAFEMEDGAAVKGRIIVCRDEKKAREAEAKAVANPANFGALAKQYSEDAPSASVNGMVQPIRKHGPCPEIEQAAFALADGQVSDVIHAQGQFVIVKRDGLISPRNVKLEDVASRLEKIIRDKKLHAVAGDIFRELQKRARVENVYNNDRLRQQVGQNVVALVNGAPIYLHQLDEECLSRHGTEVLQGLIGKRMLELDCEQHQIAVNEQEVDAEIARLASMLTRPLPNGSPDVNGWLEVVTKQQGVSVEVYRREMVWPSVALRKLAVGRVEVTDEDLKKGFEANYGPRVRCRAIVLSNLRRATEIWDKLRKTQQDIQEASGRNGVAQEGWDKVRTPPKESLAEAFADLAARYSIEAGSRANGGLVPPIRRNGGQPRLEEEAFALQPGDLSGVVNVDDKFVILYCEGRTEPVPVDFRSVKKDIEDDIREKKQRLAMADYYDHLQQTATIDNFLEPQMSRSPIRGADGRPIAGPVQATSYEASAAR